MAGAQAVLTGLIFALAIRMGEGGLSRADAILIAIAGGGVAGWILVDEPIVATVCVIAADLIAAAMMVPKVCRDPGSETLVTFVLASVGGALAVGAVGTVDASLLCYPIYYCLVNAAIALLIHHRRAVASALAGAPDAPAQLPCLTRMTAPRARRRPRPPARSPPSRGPGRWPAGRAACSRRCARWRTRRARGR